MWRHLRAWRWIKDNYDLWDDGSSRTPQAVKMSWQKQRKPKRLYCDNVWPQETLRPPCSVGSAHVEVVLYCSCGPALLGDVQIGELRTGVVFFPVRTIHSTFQGAESSSLHGPFVHCQCLTVSEHALKSLLLHSCLFSSFFLFFFLQLRSFKQEPLTHKNRQSLFLLSCFCVFCCIKTGRLKLPSITWW